MKLKIEAQTLHFRVSKAELVELCADHEVLLNTQLPGGEELSARIIPAEIRPVLELRYHEGTLFLYVRKKAAHTFVEHLPSREVLEREQKFEGGMIKLIFDVDIRSQKSPG